MEYLLHIGTAPTTKQSLSSGSPPPPITSKSCYAKPINPVLSLLPQFTAKEGEYEVCLSNDRRVEQDAKHVMLDIARLGVEGTFAATRLVGHPKYVF